MVLTLQSSRHFPSAVATQSLVSADGTRSVPATIEPEALADFLRRGSASASGSIDIEPRKRDQNSGEPKRFRMFLKKTPVLNLSGQKLFPIWCLCFLVVQKSISIKKTRLYNG